MSTSCVQGKLRKERGGTLLQVLHRFKTGGIGDEYEVCQCSFNNFDVIQIAAECGSNEAVRLLLEKGFVPKCSLEQTHNFEFRTVRYD